MLNKQLFSNSFIYILGDVINKAIPFFLLPILTRYLSPSDYGNIATFTVLVSVFAVFTGLSINGLINVNFFKYEKKDFKVFIANVIILLNISTFIVFFTVFYFKENLSLLINIEFEWILLALVMAAAQFLTTINLSLWIAEKKPKAYTLYQLSQTLIIAILSLVFVVGFSMNWQGQIYAQATGIFLLSVLSLAFVFKRGYLKFELNATYLKEGVKFGLPLIPHSLAGWLLTGADRIIIMTILGTSSVGLYSVGYQLGMIMSVLVTAFNKAWSPYFFKALTLENMNEKRKIVKFTYMYMICVLILSLFIATITKAILPYFVGESFLSVDSIILPLMIAFSFQGMYFMVTNYLFHIKKTTVLSSITLIVALLHIVISTVLILFFGIVGAAYATLISFLFMFILTWRASSKLYPMPWRLGINNDS